MTEPIITISNCRPDKDSVITSQGGVIAFKSGDRKTYFIDFGTNDNTLSVDLPLEVPGSGTTVHLQIKVSTPKATYKYAIQNDARHQCWPIVDSAPGDVPPQVIVNGD